MSKGLDFPDNFMDIFGFKRINNIQESFEIDIEQDSNNEKTGN